MDHQCDDRLCRTAPGAETFPSSETAAKTTTKNTFASLPDEILLLILDHVAQPPSNLPFGLNEAFHEHAISVARDMASLVRTCRNTNRVFGNELWKYDGEVLNSRCMIWAAQMGSIYHLELSLSHGGDIDAIGFQKAPDNPLLLMGTPLHWACREGQKEAVEWLLRHGAVSRTLWSRGLCGKEPETHHFSPPAHQFSSPARVALTNGYEYLAMGLLYRDLEAVRFRAAAGPDVLDDFPELSSQIPGDLPSDSPDGRTLLHDAVDAGLAWAVFLLCRDASLNCDINALDALGQAPLNLAVLNLMVENRCNLPPPCACFADEMTEMWSPSAHPSSLSACTCGVDDDGQGELRPNERDYEYSMVDMLLDLGADPASAFWV